VWPWLVQMGWRRAGWYTAYWIDKAAIPAELAQCKPDHPGAAAHIARRLHSRRGPADQVRAHRGGAGARSGHGGPLYESSAADWRDAAGLDWSWAFVLLPLDYRSCPFTAEDKELLCQWDFGAT
jgi:hypothetical protein